MNTPSLPRNFHTLVLCSNIMEGYHEIIADHTGYVPLVIESGTVPLVTLQARGHNGEIVTVLDRNTPRVREVSISIEGNLVKAYVLGTLVISVTATEPDKATVDALDLQPIGMRITGDREKLLVGDLTVANSTFIGVSTVINIGP